MRRDSAKIRTVNNPLRRVRDLLFIDSDTMRVNCGRCSKKMLVRLEEILDERVFDCEDCASRRSARP
jgi:DNA-directed RNA polymerase subunit RPC12/RpoP